MSAVVENLVKFIIMDNESCHLLTIYHIPGIFLASSLKLFSLNQHSSSIKQKLFLPSLFYRMEQKEKSLAQRIILCKQEFKVHNTVSNSIAPILFCDENLIISVIEILQKMIHWENEVEISSKFFKGINYRRNILLSC